MTHTYAVSYKINTAFYEAYGSKGWESMTKIAQYIKQTYPSIFTIADAKRGDIGNTCTRYAKAFFEEMEFDAITIAPYMGMDSIEPFLTYRDKWVIVLGLTSNQSSTDFETLDLENGQKLYEQVIQTVAQKVPPNQLMFVVGATQSNHLEKIRKIVPNHFLLVPGVGSQGGYLSQVFQSGVNNQIGLLVNSSRGIIYNFDSYANFDQNITHFCKKNATRNG